jgi:hypothetical protein
MLVQRCRVNNGLAFACSTLPMHEREPETHIQEIINSYIEDDSIHGGFKQESSVKTQEKSCNGCLQSKNISHLVCDMCTRKDKDQRTLI